jgi:hypothetical protein
MFASPIAVPPVGNAFALSTNPGAARETMVVTSYISIDKRKGLMYADSNPFMHFYALILWSEKVSEAAWPQRPEGHSQRQADV